MIFFGRIYRNIKNLLTSEVSKSDLISALSKIQTKNSWEEKFSGLQNLLEWIRLPVKVADPMSAREIRIKFILQFFERNPEYASDFVHLVSSLLARGKTVRFLYELGLAQEQGFFTEIFHRLENAIIPMNEEEFDLAYLFSVVFTQEEDIQWWREQGPLLLEKFHTLYFKQLDLVLLHEEIADALAIIAAQISSLGLSYQFRTRSGLQQIHQSPFFRLQQLLSNNAISQKQDCLLLLTACQHSIENCLSHLQANGVNLALLYTIDRLQALLNRAELLLNLNNYHSLSKFLSITIEDQLNRQGLVSLILENSRLLAKKIVERSGDKGQHYIARGPLELAHLFKAASYGGALTAFTAIFKIWIGYAHLPTFFESFFSWINFSTSFILMQIFHMSLASKQPAVLASALALRFKVFRQDQNIIPVLKEIRAAFWSQVTAAVGNVLWIIPTIIFLNLIYIYFFGTPIMDEAYALKSLKALHPFKSLTIFYAAFTGILLWGSSVFTGWIENWMLFKKIPAALKRDRRFLFLMNKEKLHIFADKFPSAFSSTLGNFMIAFLLATPGFFGNIFGLPLDIRHVTLSAGTMALAWHSLGFTQLQLGLILWPCVGVVLIGFFNFAISFILSMTLASIAQRFNGRWIMKLLKSAFT